MSVLGIIHRVLAEDGEHHAIDVTHSPWLPETAEIIFGGAASLIIFAALVKFAGPPIKKAMAARTAKIQKELDEASGAKAAAVAEAARIRQAKGDIQAERARLLADADAQVERVLVEGRERLSAELAELDHRANAEVASIRSRVNDELRAEIVGLSSAAVDYVVSGTLDDATHQQLIEDFIARVGSMSGAPA